MTQPNLSNSAAQLIALVERVERVTEEIEAKSAGFDTAILRRCIALRKIPKAEREERDALIDTYMTSLDKMEAQATKQSAEDGA